VFTTVLAPPGAFAQSVAPGPNQERGVTIVPGLPVSVWNEVAVATALVPPSASGATPSERVAGPDVVTVQLAIYDAVMAIARTHKPFAIQPRTPATGASMDAAAIEAAYRVLKGIFPSRGDKYEAAYANGMAAVPDGDAKARGQAIGAEVAAGMLALRANDGRETVLPPYVPGTGPGQFRGVNPILRNAQYTRPFATESHAQFRAPAPRPWSRNGMPTNWPKCSHWLQPAAAPGAPPRQKWRASTGNRRASSGRATCASSPRPAPTWRSTRVSRPWCGRRTRMRSAAALWHALPDVDGGRRAARHKRRSLGGGQALPADR
jgi:hypothetical protein